MKFITIQGTVLGLFVGLLLCQLNILLPYIINNFLFVTYYLCVSKTAMCRIYKFVTYVVLVYCSQFFFLSTSSLRFQLARTVFRLFPCNFAQICFGFVRKTLWFFPMVFGGNPTHFSTVISGKLKFENLSYF